MPASLYSASESGVTGVASMESKECESGAELLALQLASMFQPPPSQPLSNTGLVCDSFLTNSTEADLVPSFSAIQLCDSDSEEQKLRKSSNTTECVPVPSSEHVAEIVGRQGCKIKALRAKTNTYIKTPVRGNEPVFIVTGRREDVAAAKQEILSAADHFTHIRAARKSNINSTLALGQLMANTPGQTTIQVRVPYKVVGLVVGPKGATIKRIQQQTHTYIVTPSREKEPIFEITGLPDNVEVARREIEAHIAMRTGQLDINGGDVDILFGSAPGVIGSRFSPVNNFGLNNFDGSNFSNDRMTSIRSNNINSNDLNSMEPRYDPFTSGLLGRVGIGSSAIARSSSGSQDSGIENSSPLDTAMFNNTQQQQHQSNMMNLIQPSTNVFSNIWSTSNDGLSSASLELGVHQSFSGLGFGNFTPIQSDTASKKSFDSRLSLDLGQPLFDGWTNELSTSSGRLGNDSSMLNIITHC